MDRDVVLEGGSGEEKGIKIYECSIRFSFKNKTPRMSFFFPLVTQPQVFHASYSLKSYRLTQTNVGYSKTFFSLETDSLLNDPYKIRYL